MKPAALIFLLFISLHSLAQDCRQFLLLQKGKTVEMSIYNKKGDLAARKVYQVSDVSTSGAVTTAVTLNQNGRSITMPRIVLNPKMTNSQ